MRILRNGQAAHQAVRALIVLGFAGLIVRLSASGDILLYIAPHLVPYANLAAAGLIVLGAFQIYSVFRTLRSDAPACACGHEGHADGHSHELPSGALRIAGLYGLFLLPLALSLALPSAAFAGTIADSKGMNFGLSASANDGRENAALVELEGDESPELKALFRSKAYDRDYARLGMLLYQQDVIEMKDEWFLEKLEAINKFLDPLQDKTITITGFVYRQEGLEEGQIIVGRMAMTHCIADIAPYGLIVEAPQAAGYADDAWVTVTGTIGKAKVGEREMMKVIADTVVKAEPAANPYVYPDYDFATKI